MGRDIKSRSFFIIQTHIYTAEKAHSFLLSVKKHKLQTRGSKDDSRRTAVKATTPTDIHRGRLQYTVEFERGGDIPHIYIHTQQFSIGGGRAKSE